MDKIIEDVDLRYSKGGDGKSIIEILNIGFEPLLTPKEYTIYKKIGIIKKKIYLYKKYIAIINSMMLYIDESEKRYEWLMNNLLTNEKKLNKLKKVESYADSIFRRTLTKNTIIKRKIYNDREFKNEDQFRNIAIFESDLTRCFGHKDLDHSDDIISVVTYYTEIFDSIIHNGFDYLDKHFVFFTAGAGQTRCKKSTFVSSEKLIENANRLFCGLTIDEINILGGMNTNKYLAYTSLCQTNSEIWRDFNIDRAIVVDDIEYTISDQVVRYIYTESPEDKSRLEGLENNLVIITNELKNINELKKMNKTGKRRPKEEIEYEKSKKNDKKVILEEINLLKSKYHSTSVGKMDITIPFTDGFGISLKRTESSMIRLPFIKGLISYVPRKAFKEFCYKNKIKINKIKDIYGKFHSIDDVDYILTKSQFKMHKYYNNIVDSSENVTKTGWELYKDNFKKYNCDACRCNVEKKVKLNAKTNYQILQTLTTEMTNEEIKQLAEYDIDNLNGIGNNVQCMLNILGANEKKNDKLSYLQQSLLIYPEMLKDYYIKSLLKNTKNSMIIKFRSGKFNIEGAYTFAIPDPLACLQWWFTGERDLDNLGFVKENEVSCELFEDEEDVDCLRSPHLDHAHCIRKNKKNQETKIWVKSKGVYIGVKDIMSKLLMYDNDGDKLLVHRNRTIIDCALRFQRKYKMIPNYYEMPKANPQLLTNDSLFAGIVLAYHHGNIGTPSNEITKIFASLNPNSTKKEIEEAIEIVALRCADVNFTIDFAKTLYKPTIPKHILERYKKYSGKKVPHFFRYAKNKTIHQVEKLDKSDKSDKMSMCNIDRIYDVVQSNRIVFKDLLGKYTYKNLMSDKSLDISNVDISNILKLYKTINDTNIRRLSYVDTDMLELDEKRKLQIQLEFDSKKQRKMFVEYIGESPEYITDVLIKSLQSDINKDTLWRLFGDVIYENIKRNLEGTKICEVCGERFEYNIKSCKPSRYCNSCAKKVNKEKTRLNMMKNRTII